MIWQLLVCSGSITANGSGIAEGGTLKNKTLNN
jgi:hypothetical protein